MDIAVGVPETIDARPAARPGERMTLMVRVGVWTVGEHAGQPIREMLLFRSGPIPVRDAHVRVIVVQRLFEQVQEHAMPRQQPAHWCAACASRRGCPRVVPSVPSLLIMLNAQM